MQHILNLYGLEYLLNKDHLVLTRCPYGQQLHESYPTARRIPEDVWLKLWRHDKPRLTRLPNPEGDPRRFYFDPERADGHGRVVCYIGGSIIPHIPPRSAIPEETYKTAQSVGSQLVTRVKA